MDGSLHFSTFACLFCSIRIFFPEYVRAATIFDHSKIKKLCLDLWQSAGSVSANYDLRFKQCELITVANIQTMKAAINYCYNDGSNLQIEKIKNLLFLPRPLLQLGSFPQITTSRLLIVNLQWICGSLFFFTLFFL